MMTSKTLTTKCSKCNGDMHIGRLLNSGMVWTGKQWDDVYEKCVKGCEAKPAYGVLAYRCSSCGFIELYTADDEQA
jgi:ribosomal protein L37E